LPFDVIPTYDDFLAVPYFDRTDAGLIGKPYLMGVDGLNNSIYFMGMWNQRNSLKQVLCDLLETAGIDKEEYLFADVFPLINFSTKFGGALSKRLHLTTLGRQILIWGIQKQYHEFISLVTNVKIRLE